MSNYVIPFETIKLGINNLSNLDSSELSGLGHMVSLLNVGLSHYEYEPEYTDLIITLNDIMDTINKSRV